MWDFDRTLGHGWLLSSCYAEILSEQQPPVPVARGWLTEHFGTGFPWHTPDEPHLELNDPDAWWAHIGEWVLVPAGLGLGLDEDRARHLADLVRPRFVNADRVAVYPDTLPALTRLSQAGWTHAVVSNHCPELELILKRIGLREAVDGVFTSARVGYDKPHPEIFRTALRAFANPTEAWMVGDNAEADIAGAITVGIPAIHVVREGDLPHGAVRDLGEVADRLLAT